MSKFAEPMAQLIEELKKLAGLLIELNCGRENTRTTKVRVPVNGG